MAIKSLRISSDIVTLAEFKTQAATYLEKLNTNDSNPLLITQHGKPAGVLLSPMEYDRIQELEKSHFMAAVKRGIEDADNQNFVDMKQIKSRLGLKKSK